MPFWLRTTQSPVGEPDNIEPPLTLAWRIHGAQESWTAKVDVKASILLGMEGGALFATLSANGKDGALTGLRGWRQALEWVSGGLLVLALVFAAAAVYPRLGHRLAHVRDHHENLIYFGHVQHWTTMDLAGRLATADEWNQLVMVSGQVVRMSRTNWLKHRLVQFSLLLAISAVAALTVVVLT